MKTNTILEVHGLTKRYAAHTALQDVSLKVPRGSIFGLLGPNGAGKTTLIRIITQILVPDEGEVFINGEQLNQHHIPLIGYLPEERGLYKKMKVGEQLMYLAQLKGMKEKEARQRIKFWLERLSLTEWAGKTVEDLSKGMGQKVQFIATVLHEPELLILDEPFSGFDPINANLIKDEIMQLRERGSTIIFSTHRMESVEELCDHIALISKSRKILDGTKREIKEMHRSNTFIVEHRGVLRGLLGGDLEIIEEKELEDGYHQSILRAPLADGPNYILQKLLPLVEIHRFEEKIPSINEIFIMNVQGGDKEVAYV
jgi:ABC-2 type transport system ATP-binding protein